MGWLDEGIQLSVFCSHGYQPCLTCKRGRGVSVGPKISILFVVYERKRGYAGASLPIQLFFYFPVSILLELTVRFSRYSTWNAPLGTTWPWQFLTPRYQPWEHNTVLTSQVNATLAPLKFFTVVQLCSSQYVCYWRKQKITVLQIRLANFNLGQKSVWHHMNT
jgi:hypothetical protein